MAIGCASATAGGGSATFEICPTWTNGACACTKDANGDPEPPHRTFTFGAALPAGWSLPTAPAEYLALGKTQTQWAALTAAQQFAFMCAIESIRIVKHDLSAVSPTPLPSLVGVTT